MAKKQADTVEEALRAVECMTFEKCTVQAMRLAAQLRDRQHDVDLRMKGDELQLLLAPYGDMEYDIEKSVTEKSSEWELTHFVRELSACLQCLDEQEQKQKKLEEFLGTLSLNQLQMLYEAKDLHSTVRKAYSKV
jgi:hypothetical protein